MAERTLNLGQVFLDYLELTKPRVVSLMLLTVLVGMLLSDVDIPSLATMLYGLVGVGLCASSAAIINHLLDRQMDNKMERTQNRPLVKDRVTVLGAELYAGILALVGALILWFGTNPLTTVLTLCALVGYAFIYTLFLKPRTPQNIVIGGISGAFPPLLGWAAIQNDVHPEALMLVALIFVWTPAHFWALALHNPQDYNKANVPMLPVVRGVEFTRLQILLYAVLTLTVSMLIFAFGYTSYIYAAGAFILGSVFVYKSYLLYSKPERENSALKVFSFSNWYIMIMFAVLLADHWLLTPLVAS